MMFCGSIKKNLQLLAQLNLNLAQPGSKRDLIEFAFDNISEKENYLSGC